MKELLAEELLHNFPVSIGHYRAHLPEAVTALDEQNLLLTDALIFFADDRCRHSPNSREERFVEYLTLLTTRTRK